MEEPTRYGTRLSGFLTDTDATTSGCRHLMLRPGRTPITKGSGLDVGLRGIHSGRSPRAPIQEVYIPRSSSLPWRSEIYRYLYFLALPLRKQVERLIGISAALPSVTLYIRVAFHTPRSNLRCACSNQQALDFEKNQILILCGLHHMCKN